MNRRETGGLARDVRDLLLVEDEEPKHDDPENHDDRDRKYERELGKRLTARSRARATADSNNRHQ
jgi:hypothetical protein